MNLLESLKRAFGVPSKVETEKTKTIKGQLSPFGLPAWANALVGVLIAVLFISLFYGITLLVGGILANTINNTPGGSTPIGTTGTSPYQGFNQLFQYALTVGSFTGVAIVLAVVAVVFIVFYFLLGGAGGMGGGRR